MVRGGGFFLDFSTMKPLPRGCVAVYTAFGQGIIRHGRHGCASPPHNRSSLGNVWTTVQACEPFANSWGPCPTPNCSTHCIAGGDEDATTIPSAFCGARFDDYPVSVLWGTFLLTILLRHPGIEAGLDELRRNHSLRRLIGIESESQVPKKWNMSRFLDVLGSEPHLSLLREVFERMTRRLGELVVDLDVHTVGDASGLNARREKQKRAAPSDLPQPAGGRKEYTDESGKVVKVVEWFGYKFHLLVDVKHEVVLAYQISSTQKGDNEVLPALVEQGRGNLPPGRIKTLAYDQAAADTKVHRFLHQANISPLIENRRMWKDQTEQMLPGHDGNSNIVYDEAGTVYCYDKVSDPAVRHKMSYLGQEPQRGRLKYRCPAKHQGWSCPSNKRCNPGKTYGLTVRVKREIDLRRFPPIPRATKQFERRYKGRTTSSGSTPGSKSSGAPTMETSPVPGAFTRTWEWCWSYTQDWRRCY